MEEPRKEDTPNVQMPPPLIHLGALAVGYGLDQVFPWGFRVTHEIGVLALGLALPGVVLIGATVFTLWRHHTTVLPHRAATELVTSGPFRMSRNPIYLGFTLLHLACGLSLGSTGMLLMLLPVLYVMNTHVIAEEEAFHRRKFDTQWETYSQRVRRWI